VDLLPSGPRHHDKAHGTAEEDLPEPLMDATVPRSYAHHSDSRIYRECHQISLWCGPQANAAVFIKEIMI